jgi:hypothetical protein
MSKSNAFETALLLLLFNNDAIANIGDASGLQPSAVDGNLYVALHTADPGEGGSQTTSETAYGSYARVAVPRTTAGFVVSGNLVSNVADIVFPTATSGPSTITHWSIGVASSGAGMVLYSGAVTDPDPIVNTGVTPRIPAGAMDITED